MFFIFCFCGFMVTTGCGFMVTTDFCGFMVTTAFPPFPTFLLVLLSLVLTFSLSELVVLSSFCMFGIVLLAHFLVTFPRSGVGLMSLCCLLSLVFLYPFCLDFPVISSVCLRFPSFIPSFASRLLRFSSSSCSLLLFLT